VLPGIGGDGGASRCGRAQHDAAMARRIAQRVVAHLLIVRADVVRADHLAVAHDSQAIADYSKAIELDPSDAEAYFIRGRAYADQWWEKHTNVEAIDYNTALALAPNDAETY
jgi:Tfp pilus assembly protein PilF